MQKARKMLLVSTIILVLFALSGCYTHGYRAWENKWKPTRQPDTKWVSDKGDVVFYVGNNDELAKGNYPATGIIYINDEAIEIYMFEGLGKTCDMFIYPADVQNDEGIYANKRYEYWVCKFKSEEEFVATIKETTFFKTGEKITFLRVDEE